MAGKETNFTLGTRGVNLVDEPLALQDGDLQNAQNAEFRRDAAAQGIGKRGGLARLNASDLGGSVLGGAHVPLPSPLSSTLARAFHAALGTVDSDTWDRSTNGTTWASVTTPARAQTQAQAPGPEWLNQTCGTLNGVLVYAGNDYVQYPAANATAPPIRVYDGTTDAEICRVPYNPDSGAATQCIAVLCFAVHRARLFLGVHDNGPRGRVLELDLETGQLTQIGGGFSTTAGYPYCLVSHNGLLWAGTSQLGGGTGYIYSFRVDVDTAWTLRVTTAVGAGQIRSLASYGGILYYGTQGIAGTDALLRTLANDYTTTATSDTGSKVTDPDGFDALMPYDGDLYCVYTCATENICQIRVFDGTSWTTDLDIFATEGRAAYAGQPFANTHDDSLLIPFLATNDGTSDGFIYRKSGGTWTKVVTGANIRGFLGRVDTQ